MMTRREALAQLGLIGVSALLIPTVRLAALGPNGDQAYELDGIRFAAPQDYLPWDAVDLFASFDHKGEQYDHHVRWNRRDYSADPQTVRALFERQTKVAVKRLVEGAS